MDIATPFDGSWKRPGWSSTKGVAAAIAQSTSKVVDVVFKSNTCRECEKIKEKRNARQIDEVAYVDWVLKHEEQCLQNHNGSTQVVTYH